MRVLVPLRSFDVGQKEDLYNHVKAVVWQNYIPSGKTFSITARVDHHQFNNSLYAAQVTLSHVVKSNSFFLCLKFACMQLCKDAIVDQYKEQGAERPNVDVKEPDIQIQVFVHEGTYSLLYYTLTSLSVPRTRPHPHVFLLHNRKRSN